MTGHSFTSAVAIGPDALHIPVEPGRLRAAVSQIRQLVDLLDTSHKELDKAAHEEEPRGQTAVALNRVVRFSRFTARRDSHLLRDLADSVEALATVVDDMQGHGAQRLQQRWRNAREELTGNVAHLDVEHPHQVVAQIDDNLTKPYEDLFRELHGSVSTDLPGHGIDLDSRPRLQAAVQEYRQTVRPLLEEFQDDVQRIRQAERRVRAEMEWVPKDRKNATPDDSDDGKDPAGQKDARGISGAPVLRGLIDALRQGSDVLEQAKAQIESLAKALEDGMLPRHGRRHEGPEHEGALQQSWSAHFDRRIKRMGFVTKTAHQMADELQALDEKIANEIFPQHDEE